MVVFLEYLWFLSVSFKVGNLREEREERKNGKNEKTKSQISRLYFIFYFFLDHILDQS